MAISGLQTVGIRPVSTRTRNSGLSIYISVYETINTRASHFSIQRFVNLTLLVVTVGRGVKRRRTLEKN